MFEDRREAGRLLAHQLAHARGRNPKVLAVPRGGVPVAFEVAAALEAPLDLLLVARIAAPGKPGVGVGAVVEGWAHPHPSPEIIVREDMAAALHVPEEVIESEGRRLAAEFPLIRQRYGMAGEPPELADATAILVDDGVATGVIIEAALSGLRRARPRRVVLAVPVVPLDLMRRLQAQVDVLVCLATPAQSQAVGLYYRNFEPVTDEEVAALMRRAARDDSGLNPPAS